MGCCCAPCVRYIGTDRLDFDLDDGRTWKEAFGRSSLSCCKPIMFLCARAFLFSFWLCVMVWDWIDWIAEKEIHPSYWFIYLTHWGATIELVWLFFGLFTTGMALYGQVPDGTGSDTPWFVSVTWVLYSFAPLTAFLVFALYWALVYDPDTTDLTALSVLKHGANFAVAMVDVLICRQPLYLAHVYVPLLLSASYIAFSLVYWKAGGENEDGNPYIYSALDWRIGGTKDMAILIVLVVVPVTYLACVCMVACRTTFRRNLVKNMDQA